MNKGWYPSWGKRICDLSAVIITAPITAPVMLVIFVTFGLRGELRRAIFSQQRPGLHGKPFNLIKFRTMLDQRDVTGTLLPDVIRLTKFGRFLRRYSLDELPQLWNVLRGEMSLIGPRPLLMQYLSRYNSEQARRHEVKPGITGWAQVNGRNLLSWEDKFRYDVFYVDHCSFWLDVRILVLTVLHALRGTGINPAASPTMDEFQGTSQ